jgi:beta-lactamase regulating signal transducer with metallopeptidase domain
MESLTYNISQVLGITILHSLWQGLLIYFILRIALIAAPSLSPIKTYNLAIIAMVSMFVWFIYTLTTEVQAYNWVNLKTIAASPLLPYLNLSISTPPVYNQFFYYAIAGYLPYISTIYIAGLVVNLVRLALGWNKIRLIKSSVIPAGQMQQYINTFSKALNIGEHIQLKFSNLVDVPCMIGYFKPLILLPVSIATHLSACEIEAILLHELAHIKRNDYLVSRVQQFITVVLFFNPFTQLINRLVNREREHCCDDMVVEKTGKSLIYARALLKLEETRTTHLQFALAATGKRYHLLNRIERIMKTNKPIDNIRHLIIAILLLAGSLSSIAWFSPKGPALKFANPTNPGALNAALKQDNAKDLLNMSDSRFAAITDSTISLLVNDTTKHKHKAANKKRNKKEYNAEGKYSRSAKNSNHNQNYNYNTEGADSLKKFYSSPEWRSQMEAMRKQGEEMRKQFDSPEWRNQMEKMRKQGEEMKKHFSSRAWKNQMEAMKKQGEEMKKQFNSPEWKNQMAAMRKQGEEMKKQFESPEWKNQMEDIRKQGEEMKKQFSSQAWKNQMEDMRKQGEEMKKQFSSQAWKNQMEVMKKQGEVMKKRFDSPEWKHQMELMRKHGEEMKKQFNSPEWKKSMKEWKWDMEDEMHR